MIGVAYIYMRYGAWVLKLWYAYRYWYANHCLLVLGLISNRNVRINIGVEKKKPQLDAT